MSPSAQAITLHIATRVNKDPVDRYRGVVIQARLSNIACSRFMASQNPHHMGMSPLEVGQIVGLRTMRHSPRDVVQYQSPSCAQER
jgi:hypothetical protein